MQRSLWPISKGGMREGERRIRGAVRASFSVERSHDRKTDPRRPSKPAFDAARPVPEVIVVHIAPQAH